MSLELNPGFNKSQKNPKITKINTGKTVWNLIEALNLVLFICIDNAKPQVKNRSVFLFRFLESNTNATVKGTFFLNFRLYQTTIIQAI